MSKTGISRRHVLKLVGIVGAMTAVPSIAIADNQQSEHNLPAGCEKARLSTGVRNSDSQGENAVHKATNAGDGGKTFPDGRKVAGGYNSVDKADNSDDRELNAGDGGTNPCQQSQK